MSEPEIANDDVEQTIDHNLACHNQTMRQLASYNTATCPECGEPGNPTLLATWGHCVRCHNRQFQATHA